ncbi:hypothetical protein LX36DRAFT_485813 [Colletotrichum falcatum]|nr:hypothetical protein LX36DRAFT_485813 [Colletotrichum falcatum]
MSVARRCSRASRTAGWLTTPCSDISRSPTLASNGSLLLNERIRDVVAHPVFHQPLSATKEITFPYKLCLLNATPAVISQILLISWRISHRLLDPLPCRCLTMQSSATGTTMQSHCEHNVRRLRLLRPTRPLVPLYVTYCKSANKIPIDSGRGIATGDKGLNLVCRCDRFSDNTSCCPRRRHSQTGP